MSLKAAFACLLSLLALTSAVRAEPQQFEVHLTAAVTIAADGSIQALEWQESQSLRRLIAERIEPSVRKWRFVPGTLDGVPAVTQTFLSVHFNGTEGADGSMRLQFQSAGTGARSQGQVRPDYPVAAFRQNEVGAVVAIVDFDERGAPTMRSHQYRGRGSLQDGFVAATQAAVAKWKVDLERVGGRPVSTSLRIRFKFCMSGVCGRLPEADDDRSPQDATQAVALESAVRLLPVSDPLGGS